MLIKRELLIGQLSQCCLSRDEAFSEGLFGSLALGDVRTDRNILAWFSIHREKWNYSRIHPVDRAVLGAIFDLLVPHFAVSNGVVHLLEKFFGMVAGVENAVIPTDEFFFGVFADRAKLVVHVSNRALDVGDGNDGMLIQSKLLVSQFPKRSLTCGKAFLQGRGPLFNSSFQISICFLELTA
jgi:hypothetical protein